jgi:hypothetical protein
MLRRKYLAKKGNPKGNSQNGAVNTSSSSTYLHYKKTFWNNNIVGNPVCSEKTSNENIKHLKKHTLQCEKIANGFTYAKERSYKGAMPSKEYIENMSGDVCYST